MLSAFPICALIAAFVAPLGPLETRAALPSAKSAPARLKVASPRAGQRKSACSARPSFPRSFKKLTFKKISLPDEAIEVPDKLEDDEVDISGGAIRHERGTSPLLFFDLLSQFTGPARAPCAPGCGRGAPASSQRRFLSLCRLLF